MTYRKLLNPTKKRGYEKDGMGVCQLLMIWRATAGVNAVDSVAIFLRNLFNIQAMKLNANCGDDKLRYSGNPDLTPSGPHASLVVTQQGAEHQTRNTSTPGRYTLRAASDRRPRSASSDTVPRIRASGSSRLARLCFARCSARAVIIP